MISIDELTRSFQSDADRALLRLFIDVPPAEHLQDLIIHASVLELSTNGDSDGIRIAEIADEAAHLLCDAQDLISRPAPAKTETAMLAATLFSVAGYEAKAATLLALYDKPADFSALQSPQEPLTSVIEVTNLAYAAVLRRSMTEVRALSARSLALVASGVTGHVGRYAIAMARLLEDLYAYCTRVAAPRPDEKVVLGKCRLIVAIAEVISSAELLEYTTRLASAIRGLAENALIAVIDSSKADFSPDALAPFVGGTNPIYSLWPGQRDSVAAGLLSASSSFVGALPTSAGKTMLAELRIAQFISDYPDKLVVYLAPYNALASQICRAFNERFSSTKVGTACVWTGAFELDLFNERPDHILITTPEKFDSIIRRARLRDDERCVDIVNRLGLLIADEVHMVGIAGRGLALELLLSRVRRLYPSLPILALSAVAGNPEQLGQWLADDPEKAVSSKWSPTRREVLILERDGRLHTADGRHLVDLEPVKDIAPAAAKLAKQFVESGAGPVLVFCTQRAYAEKIAELLSTAKYEISKADVIGPRQLAERIQDRYGTAFSRLTTALRKGIAYHHAGLPQWIKSEIEDLARAGNLAAVSATTTLAEGIHLPFRSLIVPYLSFAGEDYVDAGLLRNVIGRAGRAYSNVRATIVIIGPTAAGAYHFKNELLPFIESPGPIHTQLANISTSPSTTQQLSNALRLEDQLLGILSDSYKPGEELPRVYGRTLASRQLTSHDVISDFASTFYDSYELRAEPFVARNSPLTLTPLGRVAALSGLSARSIELLRSSLLDLAEDHDWFEPEAWFGPRLTDSILEIASQLCVSAYEYMDHCIVKKTRDHAVRLARAVSTQGREELENATILDRRLLYHWFTGAPASDVVAATAKEVDKLPKVLKAVQAETSLLDLLSQRQQTHLWILSAGVRISELICEQRELRNPAYKAIIDIARYGVPSFQSAALAAVGMDRVVATKLDALLNQFHRELEETTLAARAREVLRFAKGAFSDAELKDARTTLGLD